VGQKPDTPMILNVLDTQGQSIALSSYTGVQLLIKSPTGAMVVDGGGTGLRTSGGRPRSSLSRAITASSSS
jgi:hypothetical protein